MTYEELHPLLAWRAATRPPKEGWTAETLAEALSVRGMGVRGWNPSTTDAALAAFRDLLLGNRVAICQRFLEESRPPLRRGRLTLAMTIRRDQLALVMTRQRALELGLLTCDCGHPENNHFRRGEPNFGGRSCARCEACKSYRERGISGVEVRDR